METILDYLKVILILCGFLYITYLTTKFVAIKQSKAYTGKHISVEETVFLGKDRCLHLVRAGKQYLLISSTAKSVELLTTVDIDSSSPQEKEQVPPKTAQLFDFKSILEKYTGMLKNKKAKISVKIEEEVNRIDISELKQHTPEGQLFRNNLEKIKKMTQKTQKQLPKNGDDTTNEK
jgi:flagellar biogenesis protein FliO